MPYRGPTEAEAKQHVRAWLKDYLSDTKTSQAQLAKDLGLSEATISNTLKGVQSPGFRMLSRLSYALGVDLAKVLRHHPTKGRATDVAPQARK